MIKFESRAGTYEKRSPRERDPGAPRPAVAAGRTDASRAGGGGCGGGGRATVMPAGLGDGKRERGGESPRSGGRVQRLL